MVRNMPNIGAALDVIAPLASPNISRWFSRLTGCTCPAVSPGAKKSGSAWRSIRVGPLRPRNLTGRHLHCLDPIRRAISLSMCIRPRAAKTRNGLTVPLYYFRIRNGRFSGVSDNGFDLADRDAAWAEMTKVCGDLVGGISRSLKQNAEWHMELLDESRKPLFRIRLVAETLD